MSSKVWPGIFILCLCVGVATLYYESGPSSSVLSSRATETAIKFNELKAELSQATGERPSSQVASWKARAELLALDGIPLGTLNAIYRKLLTLEFTDQKLRRRTERALSKLESLLQKGVPEAVESLGETLSNLGRVRTQLERESLFGELDVYEIYFYRLYKTDVRGKIEALFFAAKAAQARYFQGIEYVDRYLELCETLSSCQHVDEAEKMKAAHSSLMEKFESD